MASIHQDAEGVVANEPTKKDSIKKSSLESPKGSPTIPQKELTEQIEGVIGEDDEIPYDEGSRFYFKVLARNNLRAEQRARLGELL